jgi:hypothetical protein
MPKFSRPALGSIFAQHAFPALRLFLLLGGVIMSSLPTSAQTKFPSKPIRLIVPFPASGGTDSLARARPLPVRRLDLHQI